MAYDAYLSDQELEQLARGRAIKLQTTDGDTIWIDAPTGGLNGYDG